MDIYIKEYFVTKNSAAIDEPAVSPTAVRWTLDTVGLTVKPVFFTGVQKWLHPANNEIPRYKYTSTS